MGDKKDRDDAKHSPPVISITLEGCCDSEVEYRDSDSTNGANNHDSEDESDSDMLCDECKKNTHLLDEEFYEHKVKETYYGKLKKKIQDETEKSSKAENTSNNKKLIDKIVERYEEKFKAHFNNSYKGNNKRDSKLERYKDGTNELRGYTLSKYGLQPKAKSNSNYLSSLSEHEIQILKGSDTTVIKSRPRRSVSSREVRNRSRTCEDSKQMYNEKTEILPRKRPHSQYCDFNCRRVDPARKDFEDKTNGPHSKFFENTKNDQYLKRSGNEYEKHKRKVVTKEEVDDLCERNEEKLKIPESCTCEKSIRNDKSKKRRLKLPTEERKEGSCGCIKNNVVRENSQIEKSVFYKTRELPGNRQQIKPIHFRRDYLQSHEQISSDNSILMVSSNQREHKSRTCGRRCQSLDRNNWSFCRKCSKLKDPQRKNKRKKEINKLEFNYNDPSKKKSEDWAESTFNKRSKSKPSIFFKNFSNGHNSTHPDSSLIMIQNFRNSEEIGEPKQRRVRKHYQVYPCEGFDKNLESTRTKSEHYGSKLNSHCESNCNKVKEICDRLKMVFDANMRKGFPSSNARYFFDTHHAALKNEYKDRYQDIDKIPKKMKPCISQGCQTEFVCKCVRNLRTPKYNQITQTFPEELNPIKKKNGMNEKFSVDAKVKNLNDYIQSKRKHKSTVWDTNYHPEVWRAQSLGKIYSKQKIQPSLKAYIKNCKPENFSRTETKLKKEKNVSSNNVYEKSLQERVLNICNNNQIDSKCDLKDETSESGKCNSEDSIQNFDKAFQELEKNLKTIKLNSLKSPNEKKERASDKWKARIENYSQGNY